MGIEAYTKKIFEYFWLVFHFVQKRPAKVVKAFSRLVNATLNFYFDENSAQSCPMSLDELLSYYHKETVHGRINGEYP